MNRMVAAVRSSLRSEIDKHGTIVYKVSGTSMLPLLKQETDLVVICKISAPLKPRDIVLYQRDNGTFVLHRVIKVHGGSYTMRGDNCLQLEHGIRRDQILGKLTQIVRDGKSIDLSSNSYEAYARIMAAALPRRVRVKVGTVICKSLLGE